MLVNNLLRKTGPISFCVLIVYRVLCIGNGDISIKVSEFLHKMHIFCFFLNNTI